MTHASALEMTLLGNISKQYPSLISTAIPPFAVARRVMELLSERSLSAIVSATDAGTDCVSAIATTMTIVKIIYHFSLGEY